VKIGGRQGSGGRSYVPAASAPALLDRLRLRARARLAGRLWRRHPNTRRRVRQGLQVAVWSLLAWRLWHVGWGDVLTSLPSAPAFYGLLLLVYAAVPVADALIYAPWWRVSRRGLMAASFRKRVYNEDVLEYSGEAAFVDWAERAGVERGQAIRDVRDNNILSATVAMAATLAVAAAALAWSGVGWSASTGRLAALAALPLVVVAVVLAVLRRRAFALSAREALRVSGIHTGRVVAVAALTVAMWAVAVPGTPLRSWVVLLATQLLVSRIPLVPAKDLLFVSIGVTLSSAISEAQAAVAGALLVQVAATKLLNVTILLATMRRERTTRRTA